MKILAIGAHPDDIELGCGGLLIRSKKMGYDINYLILTRGEAGSQLNPEDDREAEARESAKAIGATLSFGGFEDTKLMPDGTLVNAIEKIVNKVRPDIVLTHSVKDEHHDHRAVGSATIEAARYVRNILAYENPLTKDFSPQVYIDISDVVKEKIKLLNLYPSQREKDYLKSNAIYGLAQYRAYQSRVSGIKFAEAFQVIKGGLSNDLLK
ncbi:PIG-L family deacetylase [Candidatus Bathyarchaeota archaeon]|nr:PIG-L family deacetylase [Candidatus Bathyarchaeota archaeon]